jgi:hypothetical protein
MTETELDHYDKGNQKGDMGQRNRQNKHMLRTFVQDIKNLNVTIVFTSQVYKNQDITNGEGVWIVSDAVKYSASQILLVSKLKLKEGTETTGVRMKCEGYKTRFTKPFQHVTVEVPYDTGMDPYSGLKEVAVALGVLQQRGARLAIDGQDETFFERDISKFADIILKRCEEAGQDKRIEITDTDEVDLADFESGESAKSKRKAKAADTVKQEG